MTVKFLKVLFKISFLGLLICIYAWIWTAQDSLIEKIFYTSALTAVISLGLFYIDKSE